MSDRYKEIFENEQDQEYVTNSPLPNGGTLIVTIIGDIDIGNWYVSEAKKNLGTLQNNMSVSKISQSQIKYDRHPPNQEVIFSSGSVDFLKSWKITVSVEIHAFNGYGFSPDMGNIRIVVSKKFDDEASTKVECLGFIYQLKLDNPAPDSEGYYYTPSIFGETPKGEKIYNAVINQQGQDYTFVGYPDHGAKYILAAYWKNQPMVFDQQVMYIVSETNFVDYEGGGPQTPIVEPYSFTPLRDGWEWVTEWTFTEGGCGAELSDHWSETTFHTYASFPDGSAPNSIFIWDSPYGSYGYMIECGASKPGGIHYNGGHEIIGTVFIPGQGTFTYGCKKSGANWAYNDAGIPRNDYLAHGYSQAGSCIALFGEELGKRYQDILDNLESSNDPYQYYKDFSVNYVSNPVRNKEGRGLILQCGWEFSGKDISLRLGGSKFGEVSLIMIERSTENMDFSLSQEVLDAGSVTYGSPHTSTTVIATGSLYIGNSPWFSASTTNENLTISTSYESSPSPRFGADIIVERGIHKVTLDDERSGKAVCWCLTQLSDKQGIRLVWNQITIPVVQNDVVSIYVGEMPIEMFDVIAWKSSG